MRALIQRVSGAYVTVEGATVGACCHGFLIFLGVMEGDDEVVAQKLVTKISKLRIFQDDAGKVNLTIKDVGGESLIVSQFTLGADTSKGNRPSFTKAAAPEKAKHLYEYFCKAFAAEGIAVATGVFGADMQVSLVNDGPFTIYLDSEASS